MAIFVLLLVSLVTSPTISPEIGPRSEVLVSIPANAANGYISFSPAFLHVSIAEPESGSTSVELQVIRSGAYGQANVTWQVSTVTASLEDIGATSGIVSIADGECVKLVLIVFYHFVSNTYLYLTCLYFTDPPL